VTDVHDRLGRDDTDARFAPKHAIADREDPRLHGAANLAGLLVEAENGKRAGFGERIYALRRLRREDERHRENDCERKSLHGYRLTPGRVRKLTIAEIHISCVSSSCAAWSAPGSTTSCRSPVASRAKNLPAMSSGRPGSIWPYITSVGTFT